MVFRGGRPSPFVPPFLVLVLPPALGWWGWGECKETRGRGREGGRKCEEGGEGEWRRRRRVGSQGGSKREGEEGYVAGGRF